MMNAQLQKVLQEVTGLHSVPAGAYNFRINAQGTSRGETTGIQIKTKPDKPGIDVIVKPGTTNETVYIPVLMDQSGLTDRVYNDFFIGEDSDITIVAGCGIHNDGQHSTQHDGIHCFHVGENARVKYLEKHYGEGNGSGSRVLNPETIIHLAKGSRLEMESIQIDGVDSTKRISKATIEDDATLITREIIQTSGVQTATTDFYVDLNGKDSSCTVSSRSVAKGQSKQVFSSVINGNNACKGHSECDAIIMDEAMVKATPDVTAYHMDAELIHEAAIGKIAGEQITKLMTLGLSQEKAEAEIIAAFLR